MKRSIDERFIPAHASPLPTSNALLCSNRHLRFFYHAKTYIYSNHDLSLTQRRVASLLRDSPDASPINIRLILNQGIMYDLIFLGFYYHHDG